MTDDAPAPMGHNKPPSITEKMAAAYHGDLHAVRRWSTIWAFLPEEIALDDTAGLEAVTGLVRGLRSFQGTLDVNRRREQKPHEDDLAEVRGFFNPQLQRLETMKVVAQKRLDSYVNRKAEAERLKAMAAAQATREEGQRRADSAANLDRQGHSGVAEELYGHAEKSEQMADALERRAAGPASDLARTSTGAGTVSASTKWDFAVTDTQALRATLGKLADHFTQADIDKAIRAFVAAEKKAGRAPELVGVTFNQTGKGSGLMAEKVTHYSSSSKGEVEIAGMNYFHLKNAAGVLAEEKRHADLMEEEFGRQAELDEVNAEIARRDADRQYEQEEAASKSDYLGSLGVEDDDAE